MAGSAEQPKENRTLIWMNDHNFRGWICSRCEWNSPLPTLLSDPEAKSAYDRLAAGKFRQHLCEDHRPRLAQGEIRSFTVRVRKLVAQGFKPKDAVEILLQEVSLETNNDPEILQQARSDGEDFLRRVREGLV